MKNKKGFISITIVYTFVVVFLLIMLAMIASYSNKRYLKNKISLGLPKDKFTICQNGDSLTTCLFNGEIAKSKEENSYYTYTDSSGNTKNWLDGATSSTITTKINNRKKPDFSNPEDGKGMFEADDDYGKSYYYRGNIDNNYVSFAGYTWRVVRVNGDGSIRIILEDIDSSKKEKLKTIFNSPNVQIIKAGFSNDKNVGLMYGNPKWNSGLEKDSKFANDLESELLQKLYEFYENNIEEKENYLNESTNFCADKNVLDDDENPEDFIKEFCQKQFQNQNLKNFFCDSTSFSYANFKMNYYESLKRILNNNPSLICSRSGATAIYNNHCALNLSNYSKIGKVKYNVSKDYKYEYSKNGICGECDTTCLFGNKCETKLGCSAANGHWTVLPCDGKLRELTEKNATTYKDDKSVVGNGQLKYAIGTISMDEIILAGSTLTSQTEDQENEYKSNNNSSISSTQFSNYWSGSTAMADLNSGVGQEGNLIGEEFLIDQNDFDWTSVFYFVVDSRNNMKLARNDTSQNIYVRPVINLNSDIKNCNADADGTKEHPWVVGEC